jgi:hypothetical protein
VQAEIHRACAIDGRAESSGGWAIEL